MTVPPSSLRFQLSPATEGQVLLGEIAYSMQGTYQFLSELKKRTEKGEQIEAHYGKWLSIKRDVVNLRSRIVFIADPILIRLGERLRDASSHLDSAFARIHQVQPIYVDLVAIEEKITQLDEGLSMNNPGMPDEFVINPPEKELCRELRALFASTQAKITAVGYPILVDPQKDFNKLYKLYEPLDAYLVSGGIFPPLPPLSSS